MPQGGKVIKEMDKAPLMATKPCGPEAPKKAGTPPYQIEIFH
jgi:hypothetical protein